MALMAFLQHGPWGGPYRTESVKVRETESPKVPSVSGYGDHLPTPYMVHVDGKWRRVYAVCHSNVATYYIGRTKAEGTVVTIEQFEAEVA